MPATDLPKTKPAAGKRASDQKLRQEHPPALSMPPAVATKTGNRFQDSAPLQESL